MVFLMPPFPATASRPTRLPQMASAAGMCLCFVTPVTRRCHIAQSREVCAPRSQSVIRMTCALRESAFLVLCSKDAESMSFEMLKELLEEKFVPPQRSYSIVISCLDVLLGRFYFVVIREISLLL